MKINVTNYILMVIAISLTVLSVTEFHKMRDSYNAEQDFEVR